MFGDLAFFYDMNALGNRHVGNNIRILMVNNGRGQEFRNYINPAFKWGASADDYVAASGHFGNMSHQLVKHMAEDLGYEYFSASNKEELQTCAKRFLTTHMTEKPMFFEVFTDTEKENEALYQLKNMKHSGKQIAKNKAKELLQKTLGENAVSAVKKIIG
jgi:2-succinyl-5-enolpyruvyl-6-hydroxy-3-cyclohexene-1-carboxylate synthase